jgi:hypothetical protein
MSFSNLGAFETSAGATPLDNHRSHREPISSPRELLRSKAVVVSVAETPGQDSGRHGRERRAQANRCRSVESGLGDVRTGGRIVHDQVCLNNRGNNVRAPRFIQLTRFELIVFIRISGDFL